MQEMRCRIYSNARGARERSTAAVSPWSRRNNGGKKKVSQLGKRYRCEECATEVLCTKAGEGTPACCNKEMKIQEPRPLPSSD
jgi:Desulfoferrodoxin, N-terminal domain